MYKFICPKCGGEFQSDQDRIYQCQECGYFYLVIHYEEVGWINKEAYETIKSNFLSNNKFTLQCQECGKKEDFYCNNVPGLFCYCGGHYRKVRNPKEIIGNLKDYRKKKKLSQEQMSEKLGISRSHYANIEVGKKDIPEQIIAYIDKKYS